MRVLVCGGRDFNDRVTVATALEAYRLEGHATSPVEILHGGATGADTLAGEWAARFGVPVRVFLADWDRYGRAAGPLRNARMIAEGRPDICLAFPGGAGTRDMIRKAEAAGIEVVRVGPERPSSPCPRPAQAGAK